MESSTQADTQMWATREAPATTIHIGESLLRPWTAQDKDALYEAVVRSLRHLQPWMPWATDAYAADKSGVEDYLGRSISQWEDRTSFQYALVDARTGAILGSFGLMGRVEPGSLEIGYWVHVDHTRQGLATRSAAALTDAGLAVPGVNRIEIHHDQGNTFSGRVPPRLGYVRIREEPADAPAPGGTGVHVVWAMERGEWPGSQGAALLTGAGA
jgi:ribosomal-protein-serine acetyltransferase